MNKKMSAQFGQTLKHNIRIFILSLVFGLVIGGGLIIARAWTEPTTAPPGGNLGAPINTSAVGQTKSGNLTAANLGAFNVTAITNVQSANIYASGNVGIGDPTPDNGMKLDVEGKVGATEYCDQNGGNCKTISSLLTNESDPQVGSVTNGKWCRGWGGTIVCDQDAPSGGGSAPPTSCAATSVFWSSHCCGNLPSTSVGGQVTATSGGNSCSSQPYNTFDNGSATYSCTTSGWQRISCSCNGNPC